MKPNRSTQGFTFIEVLVTATIIVVLATVGMISYRAAGNSARDAKRRADLQLVRQAMVQYRVNREADGDYPSGTFDQVVGVLQTADYLSDEPIVDPGTSTYTCDCTTSAFTLSVLLSDGTTTYSVTSP